jgi:uncharacterized membrane protein
MQPYISLPIAILITTRAYRRRSLTPLGCAIAFLSALAHSLPQSSLPFALLLVFFVLGTSASKVKHAEKSRLTLSSSGQSASTSSSPSTSSVGETRTHIQVLANSACVSVLCLLEFWFRAADEGLKQQQQQQCVFQPSSASGWFPSWSGYGKATQSARSITVLECCLVGAIANYAATTADTLGSELGILSRGEPFLITAPWRRVPRGTNGGVSLAGTLYGFAGATVIGLVSAVLLPFCEGWDLRSKGLFAVVIGIWGTLGSFVDSLLGALLQASVVDRRTGKVVEGAGGVRVLTHRRASSASAGPKAAGRKGASDGKAASTDMGSRIVNTGHDILDNNGVNFLMAFIMTAGGIAAMDSWLKGI